MTPRWIKSSFSSDSVNCVYIHWHQSSLCAGGDCVRVAAGEDAILVRDSKQVKELGDEAPILRFSVQSWWVLTDAIVVAEDMWAVAHRSIAYDGDEVILSTSVRSPRLRFDRGEWEAFVYGVRAGEFDPFTLSSPAAARGCEPVAGRTVESPVADGSDQAATGAVVTPRETAPVAAELPGWVERQRKLASLDDELESSSIVSNPTAGQPGATNDGDITWLYDEKLGEPQGPSKGAARRASAPRAGQGPVVAGRPQEGAGTGTSPGPVPAAEPQINFSLLAELATKPHPLLNIGDEPSPWWGEVHQEARNTHHLLDMVGIPHGKGYAQDLDARAWLAVVKLQQLQERLDRIAAWHSRQTGPSGTFDDYCRECGCIWPCDTQRMATGSYVDDETELAKAVAPLVPTDGAS